MSIKKAIIINALTKYSNVIFQMLANAILSRLLTPQDYGIIAIVSVFTTFFATFSDIGLGAGVIQNRSLTRNEINNIFSFTVYIAIVLGIVFWGMSYIIAYIYNEKEYIRIGHLLSISLIFNGMNMIPSSLLRRDERFLVLGLIDIIVYIVSFGGAIVFAVFGYKYYSLVFQSIIAATLKFLVYVVLTKVQFNLKVKYTGIKKIISYSTYNFGFDLINFFVRNTDNLLTGKVMGSEKLGYYTKGYSLMLYPVNYLTNVIAPVLHPILAKHQDDYDFIYDKFLKMFKFLSLTGVFISIFCFFNSKEIVYFLYGKQWDSVIPCIQILSVSIWFQMTASSCDSIYRSIGKTKLLFRTSALYSSIQMVLIVIGVFTYDILKLSFFIVIAYVLKFFVVTFSLIKNGLTMNVLRFYKKFIPEVFISVMMAISMFWVSCLSMGFLRMFLYKSAIAVGMWSLGIIILRQGGYIKIWKK